MVGQGSPSHPTKRPGVARPPSVPHTHIRVVGAAAAGISSRPRAVQSQGCGRQGDYIQAGGDLFSHASSNASVAAAGRQLLAEWAKFRWGIFEEAGYAQDPLYPATFRDPNTNSIRENRCVGDGSTPFCPSEAHIAEAPTKHNAQCVGRPQWDIIMQSQDFAGGRCVLRGLGWTYTNC